MENNYFITARDTTKLDKVPHNYQKEALENIQKIQNSIDNSSTAVVIPPGGGKTFTGCILTMKNWLDEGKKVLWIASNNYLVDQATITFKSEARKEYLTKQGGFSLQRIGAGKDVDSVSDLKQSTQLVLCTYRYADIHSEELKKWASDDVEYLLCIDECHHACSKSHVNVIEMMRSETSKRKGLSILGFTATPFRTNERENGALADIFRDGIDEKGNVVHENIGIAYSIDLETLIALGYLARPIIEDVKTGIEVSGSFDYDELRSILSFDALPKAVANELANSLERNLKILQTYKNNATKYQQTIIFCVNQLQAVALKGLFEAEGIKSGLAISAVGGKFDFKEVTPKSVEEDINKYRNGEISVIMTCCMLNEGFDVPNTKSVFLCKPTTSRIVSYQSIGRALRFKKTDNTAYIVNFVDDWETQISWVNPRTLFTGSGSVDYKYKKRNLAEPTLISFPAVINLLKDLEEKIDNGTISDDDFEQYVPAGYFRLTYINKYDVEIDSNILVYKSNLEAFYNLLNGMSMLFAEYNIGNSELIPEETLDSMATACISKYFDGVKPSCHHEEIKDLIRYYAEYRMLPKFEFFSAEYVACLDLSLYAKHILDNDLTEKSKYKYLKQVWEDTNAVRCIYTTFGHFSRLVQAAIGNYMKDFEE